MRRRFSRPAVIASRWTQKASRCQFQTSGAFGSRTCQASRTNPARVWHRALIRSASCASAWRSRSAARRAFSSLTILSSTAGGAGKATEESFECIKLLG